MAERRRLPVLSNDPPAAKPPEDEPEDVRPPWHWVGFGTVAIFAGWLPLAYVAGSVSAKVMSARFGEGASRDAIDLALAAMTSSERSKLVATVALPGLLALALASFGGGFIVGRFGAGTGVREAAMSGGVAAFIASALAWSGPTAAAFASAAVTFAVATGFAAWAGRFGSSRRHAEH